MYDQNGLASCDKCLNNGLHNGIKEFKIKCYMNICQVLTLSQAFVWILYLIHSTEEKD